MILNRVIILLSVCVVYGAAILCDSDLKIVNFGAYEEPHTVIKVDENCVEIKGLTRDNLDQFTNIENSFKIVGFKIDDINSLNQPNLFARHTNLKHVEFNTYIGAEELVPHEKLFNGLENLEKVALAGLNLETVPKQLFWNLLKLRTINLSGNKLKTLDPDIFSTNPKLSYTYLGDNKFLEDGPPLELIFLYKKASVSFQGSYIKDFNSLMPILRHPNVTYTTISGSNLTNIKLSDFEQFPERQIRMDMRVQDVDLEFNVTDLQEKGIGYEIIPYAQVENAINNSRAYIEADVWMGSSFCSDCRFIKQIFKYFVQGPNEFNIHLTNSKVVFAIFVGCENIENHYTQEFKSNCPEVCNCKYNPLLDKVWIDCHGKNLTSIPAIPYPTQFEKVTSIALDMSKNMIESVDVAHLEERVTHLISEINFNENLLTHFNLEQSTLPYLHQVNLCKNPITALNSDGLTVFLDKVMHNVTTEGCSAGMPYPNKPLLYIGQKPATSLDQILEGGVCH